jgi:hypothetical protein
MTRTLALAAILVTTAVAALPATASAARVTVGLGDQSWNVFGDQYFQKLGLKRVRVVTPWNVALSTGDREWLDEYLASVQTAGIEPLVSFGAAAGSRCPEKPCKLPTTAQFDRAFRAFRARWPWIRTLSVWNEENHRAQPTFRYPEQAARYFNIVKKRCRACQIVAADVLDDPNMVRWITRFQTVARSPRIWGLHNYRDGNPRPGQRYGGTKLLVKTVPGKIWLTETGGIVKLVLPDGHTLFPYSEKRANVALGRLLRLARANRRRVQRLYVYHWRQDLYGMNRFDSALIRDDGVPRPSYYTLARWLKTPWFTP